MICVDILVLQLDSQREKALPIHLDGHNCQEYRNEFLPVKAGAVWRILVMYAIASDSSSTFAQSLSLLSDDSCYLPKFGHDSVQFRQGSALATAWPAHRDSHTHQAYRSQHRASVAVQSFLDPSTWTDGRQCSGARGYAPYSLSNWCLRSPSGIKAPRGSPPGGPPLHLMMEKHHCDGSTRADKERKGGELCPFAQVVVTRRQEITDRFCPFKTRCPISLIGLRPAIGSRRAWAWLHAAGEALGHKQQLSLTVSRMES